MLAACGERRPVVSPTALWRQFGHEASGFVINVQEPYVTEVVAGNGRRWTARVYDPRRRDAGETADQMTITATRLPRGSTLAPGNLIEVGPSLTAKIIAGQERAGAVGVTLEQPLQPVLVYRTRGLEMIDTWDAGAGGVAMRTNVVVVVNSGWMICFDVTGDEAFWRETGPILRQFVDTLQSFEPREE